MFRFVVLAALMLATSSQAIVIRHDRDDSLYRELATHYPMVCRVNDGMGVLVDSEWVLTAAHVAMGLTPEKSTIRFGNRDIVVSQVMTHPDFGIKGKHRDIALLRLAEPVTDIPVAHLYRDSDEAGMQTVFVGDGRTGTGLTGPTDTARVMRAAYNTVRSVEPGWLVYRFDAPPRGDSLEGISGPGDSGGPALYRRHDSLYVIGVSAYNVGDPQCVYGTYEHYCRVSDELEWLDGVMTGRIAADTKPKVMRFGQNAAGEKTVTQEKLTEVDIPESDDTRLVDVLGKLVASIERKSQDDYLALFAPSLIEKRRQQGDPLEGMFTFMVQACAKRGPIVAFHRLSGRGLKIAESPFPMRSVVFHLKDGTPGYFGIALDDSGLIDHLSVFVQQNICPDGKDCTKSVPLDRLTR